MIIKCKICKEKFDTCGSMAHEICNSCHALSMRSAFSEPVYIDALGIAWTDKDLEEAGGKEEVDRLCRECKSRTTARQG